MHDSISSMKSISVSVLILIIWEKDLVYPDKLVLVIAIDFFWMFSRAGRRLANFNMWIEKGI